VVNNLKGYGFIGRDGGPDISVHYSGIVGEGYRTLQRGIPSNSKSNKAQKVRKHRTSSSPMARFLARGMSVNTNECSWRSVQGAWVLEQPRKESGPHVPGI